MVGGTNNDSAILVRYLANGSLDGDFGDGGVAGATSFSPGSARALLELDDQKLLAAGGLNGFALSPFAADGGSFTPGASAANTFRARGLALLPGGKTILAGEGGVGGFKCVLARYDTDLGLDTSLGPGPSPTGVVVTNLGDYRGLVRNADGALVVPINANGAQSGFGIARLTAGGVLDPGFGTNGVTLAVTSQCTTAEAIARQPSGKLVVVGRTGSGACPLQPLALVVARFTSGGTLDPTFGILNSGFQVIGDVNSELAFSAAAVVVDPQGNVIVGGTVAGLDDLGVGLGSTAFFLVRYTIDGGFDPSFGDVMTPGFVVTGFGSGSDAECHALALQPDGKLVAAGRVCSNGQCSLAVARYLMSPPVPATTATATTLPGAPTPTPTRTATPTPTATRTPAPEGPAACDDCIDNDFDGATDRGDAGCALRANGGSAGLGGTTGKAALTCQKALGKSAIAFALGRVKHLGGCLRQAFVCVQNGSDPGCLAKAGAACAKAGAARQSALAKLASVAKHCGTPPLASGDLQALAGLGFSAETAGCTKFGVASLADASDVVACIAASHTCRAEALLGAQIPRARELLVLAGRDPTSEAPCLPPGGAGGVGGDVKATLKCQKAVAKAGAAYAAARLKAEQKCVDTVFACAQTKTTDTGCRPKADAACLKLTGKVAAATKVRVALAKACGLSTLHDAAGVGYALRTSECGALGAAPDSVEAVASCLVAQHTCRVDQLLLGQAPRAGELGALAP